MDAVRPEQRGMGHDGLMPVGELSVLAISGGDGERRVDRVFPGLRAERADQHEFATGPDDPLQLPELASGDAAIGAEADHTTWRSRPVAARLRITANPVCICRSILASM